MQVDPINLSQMVVTILLIGYDLSIEKMHHAFGIFGIGRRMCHHYNCRPGLIEGAEHGHDFISMR